MNIKELRLSKKMTQQDVAEITGLTRQMISAIENGAKPSFNTMIKLSEAYECTVEEITKCLLKEAV